MKCMLYLLAILSPFLVCAQHTEQEIPLHKYFFSYEIQEGLRSGDMNLRKASQNFSYIGEYQKALSVPNEMKLEWGLDSFSQSDLAYFAEYGAVPAIEEILKIAEQEKVLIFNEAHHKPIHRVFVRRLLKGLFDRGYNLLGIEALSNCAYLPDYVCDDSLMQRGFPMNSPLVGTYIKEPQMSNLIIDAINIGYEVFPYEKFGKDRERNQAMYIAEKMNEKPDSKVLILGGGYHLLESVDKKSEIARLRSKQMGGFLKENDWH